MPRLNSSRYRAALALCAASALFVACSKNSNPSGTDRPLHNRSKSASAEAARLAPANSIGARLRALAKGNSVYFAATNAGLVAATESGVIDTLVPGAIAEGRYSALDELLLVVRDRKLDVLDLRGEAVATTTLLTGLPEGVRVEVRRAGRLVARIGDVRENVYVTVDWKARPTVDNGVEIEEFSDPELEAAAAAVKLDSAGAAWLASQVDRPSGQAPAAPTQSRLTNFKSDAFEGCDACLAAAEFGSTGWQVFISEVTCGDFCHTGCLLYDPASHRFAMPAPTPVWRALDDIDLAGGACSFEFDATGMIYAHLGGPQVCLVGGQCRDVGAAVLGFLDAGPTIEL